MNPLYRKTNIFRMKKLISLLFLLFFTGFVFSQKKKKDTLDTEVVRVVKPYSPTVSDAFKIKKNPQIDSIEINTKKEVNYHINSVPVASTFTPAKGKAKAIKREPKERFHNNYVTVGFGNYLTPFAEIFAHYNLTKYSDIGGFITYLSSYGDIKEVTLNSTFSDIKADFYYKQSEKYFEWQINAGIKNQVVNWYGLPNEINFKENIINSIEEEQSYGILSLGGEIEFFDALVHDGEVKFTRFFDKHNSDENHVEIMGNVEFPVWNELMNSYISLEFLNGNFKQNYLNTDGINHNFLNIGFSPNFTMLRDNLTLNLGAKLYYSLTNNENDKSKFYAYPNVTASYKINEDYLIAYAGIIGDLNQNTYEKFVNENPFVSPTLNIRRTDQQYLGYLGAKGKFSTNLSFNIKASYGNEIDKPLYKLNPSKTNGSILLNKGYEAGNSFEVVYDEVQTIGAFAEIIYDFDEHFKFGGNFEFNSYNLKNQEYAWNLPMLKATLLAKYTRKKWFAGANLYFASERKDELIIIPGSSTNQITNSTYFDINLNSGYYFNDRWSTFIKLNNILSDNYQKYTNFKVQGFQVMGGLTYRFDF